MYKGKRILGLIAARGGSKGLPKKNIKMMLGKPLVAWTIEQGVTSKYLDKLVVSTDDSEIADISVKHGAEVPFMRPKELSRDDSPIFDTIIHALDFFCAKGDRYDVLLLLECTSPMRYPNDIDDMIAKLIDTKGAESIIGVVEVTNEHPLWTYKMRGREIVKYFEDKGRKSDLRRQLLEKAYLPYSLYATWSENCKKYRTFSQGHTVPYLLKREQKVDIDDIVDFRFAEQIMSEYLGDLKNKGKGI